MQIKATNQFVYFTKSGVNIIVGFVEFAFVRSSFVAIVKSEIKLVVRLGFGRLIVGRNAVVKLGFVGIFSCIVVREVYLSCSLLGR